MDFPEKNFFKRASGKISFGIFFFLFYTFLFYHSAWLSDDSFITFRVVDNFLNGFGLRWNPLERVQVYTHPLWLFLLIPLQAAVREISISAYLLSFVCGISFLSVWILTFVRSSNAVRWIVFSLLILFSSKIFIDYNSSGLENPLSFLLFLLFFVQLNLIQEDPDHPNSNLRILTIGFLTSLILLTRLDLVLLLIYPLSILFFKTFQGSKIRFLQYFSIGMLLWVLYLGFSLVYFGSFFPNTFYAKTNVISDPIDRMIAGWNYIRISLKWDPIGIFILTSHLFWFFLGTFGKRILKLEWSPSDSKKQALQIGIGSIVPVFVYLFWIGGDFMAGRFIGVCLVISLFSQMRFWIFFSEVNLVQTRYVWRIFFGIVCVYFLISPSSPIRYAFQRQPVRVEKGIVDERASYQDNVSLKSWIQGNGPESHPWSQYAIGIVLEKHSRSVLSHIQNSQSLPIVSEVRVTTNVGLAGYYGGAFIHWIDLLGITDPFLARLPGKGFPGHYIRLLPKGYKEFLEETASVLPSPEMDRFYYEIRMLTEGEIGSRERWKIILDFLIFGKGNFKTRFETGFRYAYVIDEYRKTLYGIPFENWKKEDVEAALIREYFGN
ncbi:hypothetical protein AB3N59_04675 [Leptospira sp. WS92.C1]